MKKDDSGAWDTLTTMLTLVITVVIMVAAIGYLSAKWGTLPGQRNDQVDDYSFLVFKDGDMVMAKSGASHVIAYSSTDAGEVLQDCVDALPEYAGDNVTTGGIIQIKSGVYNFTTGVILEHSDVSFWGEAGQRNTMLKKAANIDMFFIKNSSGRIAFFEFRNLMFNGDLRHFTGRMIYAESCNQGPQIYDCHFMENDGAAIEFNDVWGQGPQIRDCKISACGNSTDAGIIMEGGTNAVRMESIGIAPLDYVGIYIDTNSCNIDLVNLVGECDPDSPNPQVLIDGFSCIISASQFTYAGPGVGMIEDDGDRNIISNNIISGGDIDCYGILSNGTRSVIDGNYIYNAGQGLRLEGGWATVSDNWFESCTNGINVTSTNGILQAMGNHIMYSDGNGIWLNSGGAILSDNVIQNSGTGGILGTYSGVVVLNGGNYIHHNVITDWRSAPSKTQSYGIREVAPANSNFIYDNDVDGNLVAGIVKVGSSTKCMNNLGFRTEYRGTYVVSGNGSSTYYIPHNLVAQPTYWSVTPYYPDANFSDGVYIQADATYLIVTYTVAPGIGTNNIRLNWYAEVYH